VAEWEIRDAFRPIFAVMSVRPARFANALGEDGARAWFARLTRI
jgi:hypothetical protein